MPPPTLLYNILPKNNRPNKNTHLDLFNCTFPPQKILSNGVVIQPSGSCENLTRNPLPDGTIPPANLSCGFLHEETIPGRTIILPILLCQVVTEKSESSSKLKPSKFELFSDVRGNQIVPNVVPALSIPPPSSLHRFFSKKSSTNCNPVSKSSQISSVHCAPPRSCPPRSLVYSSRPSCPPGFRPSMCSNSSQSFQCCVPTRSSRSSRPSCPSRPSRCSSSVRCSISSFT